MIVTHHQRFQELVDLSLRRTRGESLVVETRRSWIERW